MFAVLLAQAESVVVEDNTMAVAYIAAIGAVVAALLGAAIPLLARIFDRKAAKLMDQNSAEHAINKEILERVVGTVESIDSRLGEHISWHAHAQPNVVQIVRPAAEAAEGSK